MPYRIRWEGHGVYRRFFGVITLAEFREANKEMRSDVRYEGIRYIISDYLEAQPAPDITERDLRDSRRERVHFYDSPDTVQAIVATDPKNVKFARYYESLGVSPYCTRGLCDRRRCPVVDCEQSAAGLEPAVAGRYVDDDGAARLSRSPNAGRAAVEVCVERIDDAQLGFDERAVLVRS